MTIISKFFKTPVLERHESADIMRAARLLAPELEAREREEDVKRVEKITALLEQQKIIIAERDSAMPALEQAAIEAEDRKRAAEAALKAAILEHTRAIDARWGPKLKFTERLQAIEQQLKTLAHPLLDEFIHELLKLWDEARLAVDFDERESAPARITGIKKRIFSSNTNSVHRRVDAIKAAVEQAKRMRYEPLTEQEIRSRLTELKDGLPAIDHLVFGGNIEAASRGLFQR